MTEPKAPKEFDINPADIPDERDYTAAHCAHIRMNRKDYVRVREVPSPDYKEIAESLLVALKEFCHCGYGEHTEGMKCNSCEAIVLARLKGMTGD